MDFNLYPWVKLLHIGCAIASITGFTVRGLLKILNPGALNRRWLRIAPHINDSVLLACAIYLVVKLGQYPGTTHWLTAKVIGLVLYILLGMAVMKWTKTQNQRVTAFIAALGCFGYIVMVAVTRNPLFWM